MRRCCDCRFSEGVAVMRYGRVWLRLYCLLHGGRARRACGDFDDA